MKCGVQAYYYAAVASLVNRVAISAGQPLDSQVSNQRPLLPSEEHCPPVEGELSRRQIH